MAEEKKEVQHVHQIKSDPNKVRIYYLTKERVQQLNKDDSEIKKLKSKLNQAESIKFDKESGQIIVTKDGMRKYKDGFDKVAQEVLGPGNVYSEAEFVTLVDGLVSIERPRQKLLDDPAKTLSDILSVAEKGAMFKKHLDKSAQKKWFSIKGDRLYWRDKEKGANHLNRSMEMKSIVKIQPGKKTKTLKKKGKVSEDVCFSIIGIRKSLDLEATNTIMRDEWFTYMTFAHRHYVRAKKKTIYLQDEDNPLDDMLEDID